MSTDDRDIESGNPSKNFKVGDFDQLSGFFTPVWESKRRIRSEPPAPPSSKNGANRAAPSSAPPSQRRDSEAPPAPDAQARVEEPTRGNATNGVVVPRPRSSTSSGKGTGRPSAARGATPLPPAPSSERAASAAAELTGSVPPAALPAAALPAAVFPPAVLPAAVAEVFHAPTADETNGSLPPVDPAALAPAQQAEPADGAGRAASPSAAARALRDAGPDLPAAAFLDAEPEFRSPPAAVPRPSRTDRPAAQQRAMRASAAATRVHDDLKAKLQAEAAEIDESRFERDPETQRDRLQALEQAEDDPYPLSLMRRLRRTIRLSTPVPDPVRSLISKYDRG